MHVLQPWRSASAAGHVLVLATGDGNLEGQAPNTAAWPWRKKGHIVAIVEWERMGKDEI